MPNSELEIRSIAFYLPQYHPIKENDQCWGNYKIQYPICADWELNLHFFTRTQSIYLDGTIAKFYGGVICSGVIDAPNRKIS